MSFTNWRQKNDTAHEQAFIAASSECARPMVEAIYPLVRVAIAYQWSCHYLVNILKELPLSDNRKTSHVGDDQ